MTKDILEMEKIIEYMKNMNYLNILNDQNMSEESKFRYIENTMDIIHGIRPFDLYSGGLQTDF